ncbi:MAG: hypothetical protein KIT16_13070 [Rhodospirillaceae bacterium]|nr:hypothetical protein [Rhodospirillaceae bacterium]
MLTIRRLRLCVPIFFLAGVATMAALISGAGAQASYNCRVFGKSFPTCSGSCPSGWKQAYRQPCLVGSKAYCCKIPPDKKSDDAFWEKRKLTYACQKYAGNAVAAVKKARNQIKCPAATISGARWSTSYKEHQNWCLGATEAARKREEAERNRVMTTCKSGPSPGPGPASQPTPHLRVQLMGGKTFAVIGSGFLPNAPVVLLISGTPARIGRTGVANGQRIVANASGAISVRVGASDVCKSAGTIFFRAEDPDGRRRTRRPATARCPRM